MISTTKVVGRITVTIEYDVSVAVSIAPLRHEDGSPDQSAISEYEEFIINALEIFGEHDFEVVEEAESDRSHSMYFSLVKHDDFTDKDYKYILFVRISDHQIRDRIKKSRKQYYDRRANELKQPAVKKKQTWRFKEIIVNDQIFDSYDDALDEIDRRLSNLK